MKKLILSALIASSLLGACKKAEELKYDSHDNVYFDFPNAQKDSVLYTFAFHPEKAQDTIYLPVRISGIRKDADRKFVIVVDKDSTTAIAGKHYKAFEPSYTMLKNTGVTYVPLTLYNTDTALQNKSVRIKMTLAATPDFGIAIPEKLISRVVFSSKLEHEAWWDWWFDPSTYSQTKNQFFIIVTGLTSLSTNGLDAPKNQYIASLVAAFLTDPFTWVKKNPSKGYTITVRPDGNYDFYSITNPTKKILYKKSDVNGIFYFIDENGKEIR